MKSELNLSPEDNLLIASARINMDDSMSYKIKEILGLDLDWDYIMEEASRNEIESLLYHNLHKMDDSRNIPESAMKDLRVAYYATTSRNIRFLNELSKLLKTFNDANIEVVVLKGAALAETVYQNIALRPFGDIDLLIREDKMPDAEEILSDLGYSTPPVYPSKWHRKRHMISVRAEELHYVNQDKNVILDLHWDLQPRSSPFQIDVQKFWENTQTMKLAGVETLIFTPEHLLEHLCFHIYKEVIGGVSILIRHCDVNEVVRYYERDIDWGYFVETSKRYGLQIPSYYGLYTASGLLGAPVPENVLSELKPDKNKVTISLEQVLHPALVKPKVDDKEYLLNVKRRISAIKGIKNQFYYVLGHIFPNREYLIHRYSVKRPYFAYFWRVARPFLLLIRAVKNSIN